ncbi:MAG: hypothetical protein ACP5E9_02115 [Candidatus Methanospirareceae archaeon]
MVAITTPERVRNRIQATASEISDDVLNELIADEQAYIEAFAQTTFAEADALYALARSICTDRCAARAIIYIWVPSAGINYSIDELRIDKTDPAYTKLRIAQSLWTRAEEQLVLLTPAPGLRPRSSTL